MGRIQLMMKESSGLFWVGIWALKETPASSRRAQAVVREHGGFVHRFPALVVFRQEDQLLAVLIQLHFFHLAVIHHFQEIAVAHRLHLTLEQGGEHEGVEQHDHGADDDDVIDQWLAVGGFVFDHVFNSFPAVWFLGWGSTTVKEVLSRLLSEVIVPGCNSTTFFTIARPMPFPSVAWDSSA